MTATARKGMRRTVGPVPDETCVGEQIAAVDLWASIPRYSVSRTQMSKLRTPEGYLEMRERRFWYRARELRVSIYPARTRDVTVRA